MSNRGARFNVSQSPSIPTTFDGNVGTATPAANVLNLYGEIIAAGSTPFQSVASGNTVEYELQLSQAIASTDATKVGVSAFNSADFTVDANGFVSLSSGPSGAIQTIDGDSGSITGTTVTIYANNATNAAGSSVKFVNSGTTSTLQLTDASSNTFLGQSAGNLTLSGSSNTGVGVAVLNGLTSGSSNLGFGGECLASLNSGTENTVFGLSAANLMLTGSYNTIIGYEAGNTYTGAESSNIIIGTNATTGDNHIIRIGTQGNGNANQNKCFVAGIVGVTAASSEAVFINSSTGQLGVIAQSSDGQVIIGSSAGVPLAATLTAGTGISISNGHNSITISATGTTTLNVTSVNHVASPYTVLSTDDFLACQSSTGAITIKLPNAPATGRVYTIKDSNGDAFANNISVTTVGGTVTIDGSTTYTIATNYQSINVIFDGTNYEVY